MNITEFTQLLSLCFEVAGRPLKRARIERLLTCFNWIEHYKDKSSGKRVLSESTLLEHTHELTACITLAKANYEVVFAPKGMFERKDKKFDVLLIKEHCIFQADLKRISSKRPDTIAHRIKEGSDQAQRVVLEIVSDIERKDLIDGLRSGCYRNKLLLEIFLIYKNSFYILPKNLIESKRIYIVLK